MAITLTPYGTSATAVEDSPLPSDAAPEEAPQENPLLAEMAPAAPDQTTGDEAVSDLAAEQALRGLDSGAAEAAEQMLPYAYAEEARRQRWQQENQAEVLPKIDGAVLDVENFAKGKGMAPELARKRLVGSFLRMGNGGLEFQSPLQRDLFRDEYARRHFGGEGAGSDDAFFARMGKDAQGRKAHADIVREIGVQAVTSELVRLASGGIDSKSSTLYLEEARKKPGYDPNHAAIYLERWNGIRAETRELLGPAEVPFINAANRMTLGDLDLGRFYEDVKPGDQEKFFSALKLWAQAMPVGKQPEFWDNLMKSAGRGMAQASEDLLGEDSTLGTNEKFFNRVGGAEMEQYRQWARRGKRPDDPIKPSDETIQAEADVRREARDRANFRDDINRIRDESYDPIRYLNPDGSWGKIGEQIVYGMPAMVQYAGTAMIPGAGTPLVFELNRRTLYRDFRRDFMDRGDLNSQEASDVAETAAGVAAIPYTLLDKLAVGLIRGKAPFLTKTLESMANRFKSGPGRFTARALGAGFFELGIEDAQDALVPITEELAAALSKDSRLAIGAWKNGHDGYLDGFWTRQVVIFGSMAPFAGMAGLGGIDQDARATAYAQASDAQLMALGHGPQSVAAIREAQGKGMFSANLAIEEAQKTRDPFSVEAKAAVDQLVAEAEQQKAAVEQAQLSGAMPTFHHSADGSTWTVYDGTTSAEIGKAANANDALRLAAAHSTAVDEDNADLLAYLGSTMMGIGKLADGKTETLFRPGMELTAEQQAAVSESDFESIRAQMAARDLLAGTPGIAGVVLGRSVTEFKQGVRRTANQLNAGAALPTVFHETTHGHLEEAWASGALSRTETESFLRAADTIFAGKATKDGRPIRFLPDGPVSDTMLREGVSEFAEMELFRTRSGGKAGADKPAISGLPSGLISRNIAAFARLAPGAAEKFTRFMEAARSFWGVTLKRATVMDKAIREGSMSEAELDAFKEKLYGLKGPDAVVREGEASGGGAELRGTSETNAEKSAGPSFSLRPSFLRPLDSDSQTNDTTPDESLRDPARILQALAEGDGSGGLRANVGKRRKPGREIFPAAGLRAWAERHGLLLEPASVVDLIGEDSLRGGEHLVIFDEDSGRVVKLTKPGFFGAQGEDAGAYLRRWALHNLAFRDDVAFEGLVTLPGEDLPRAVISQRFIKGRDATAQEQADALGERGYHEMPDGKWIHPVRGIAVWDTITPGNAITNESGTHFIDLQVDHAPAEELAELRQGTGIGRTTSFSIGKAFPLGNAPSPGQIPDSGGGSVDEDQNARRGIENPTNNDERLSDQTGPDSRAGGIRGEPEKNSLKAALDELGGSTSADSARMPGRSAEEPGRREEREWAIVARAAESASAAERFVQNPSLIFAEGGESRVELWRDGRVLKHLKRAGFVLDLGKGIGGRDALVLRPALPGELLERVSIVNQVFGDSMRIEGFTEGEDGRATFVISQEIIKGTMASQEEIDKAISSSGLQQVADDGRIADFHLSHRTWVHLDLHLLVTDAKPQNFVKDNEGRIFAIDLIAQRVRDPEIWRVLTGSGKSGEGSLPEE